MLEHIDSRTTLTYFSLCVCKCWRVHTYFYMVENSRPGLLWALNETGTHDWLKGKSSSGSPRTSCWVMRDDAREKRREKPEWRQRAATAGSFSSSSGRVWKTATSVCLSTSTRSLWCVTGLFLWSLNHIQAMSQGSFCMRACDNVAAAVSSWTWVQSHSGAADVTGSPSQDSQWVKSAENTAQLEERGGGGRYSCPEILKGEVCVWLGLQCEIFGWY